MKTLAATFLIISLLVVGCQQQSTPKNNAKSGTNAETKHPTPSETHKTAETHKMGEHATASHANKSQEVTTHSAAKPVTGSSTDASGNPTENTTAANADDTKTDTKTPDVKAPATATKDVKKTETKTTETKKSGQPVVVEEIITFGPTHYFYHCRNFDK